MSTHIFDRNAFLNVPSVHVWWCVVRSRRTRSRQLKCLCMHWYMVYSSDTTCVTCVKAWYVFSSSCWWSYCPSFMPACASNCDIYVNVPAVAVSTLQWYVWYVHIGCMVVCRRGGARTIRVIRIIRAVTGKAHLRLELLIGAVVLEKLHYSDLFTCTGVMNNTLFRLWNHVIIPPRATCIQTVTRLARPRTNVRSRMFLLSVYHQVVCCFKIRTVLDTTI